MEFKPIKRFDFSEQSQQSITEFERYQTDPLGFGRDVLGHSYPPDVESVMSSAVDNRCTIARSATGTGKTFCVGDLAIWFLCSFPHSHVFILAAPPQDNIRNVFGYISKTLAEHPGLLPETASVLLKEVRITESHYIKGVTIPQDADPSRVVASMSGKHAPHQLFIVDEGDNVPDAAYVGVDGCMSGDHERMVILFNPRAKVGQPYRREMEGTAKVIELSAFNHPNVITGLSVYPGAVSRDITVQRICEWSVAVDDGAPKDANTFRVPDCLVGCRVPGRAYPPLSPGHRRIINPEFSYKVLGKYYEGSDTVHFFPHSYLMDLHSQLLARGEDGALVHSPARVIHAGQGQLHGTLEIYREPSDGGAYVVGADSAGGLPADAAGTRDSDYSIFVVRDRRTFAHMATYRGREGCSPDLFAGDLAAVGGWYNDALIIPESNPGGHGNTVIDRLKREHEYPNIYVRRINYKNAHGEMIESSVEGFDTNASTKSIADAYLLQMINESQYEVNDWEVRCDWGVLELANYGNIGPNRRGALIGHDDYVRAEALCAVVFYEQPFMELSKLKPITGKGRFAL